VYIDFRAVIYCVRCFWASIDSHHEHGFAAGRVGQKSADMRSHWWVDRVLRHLDDSVLKAIWSRQAVWRPDRLIVVVAIYPQNNGTAECVRKRTDQFLMVFVKVPL